MVKRLLVAAGVLWSACAGPVSASPFSVSASNVTAADGSLFFKLSGDTESRTGQLFYQEDEFAPNGVDFIMTRFTDPDARFSVTGSQLINNQNFPERSLAFTVSDPDFEYTVDTGFNESTVTGYSFSFAVAALFAPNGSIIEYDVPSAVPILLPQTFFEAFGVDVTGSPLSLVPLPASAPMFGAALAALGVLGYGLKRRLQPNGA